MESKYNPLEVFMEKISKKNEKDIKLLHRFAKRVWYRNKLSPIDIQNACMEKWDEIKHDLGSEIIPLVPVHEEGYQVKDVIFGSGSFSTGEFQAQQFDKVRELVGFNPITLSGIVANKSEAHNCNGKKVAEKFDIPLIELDFVDWYHEFIINEKDDNPIRATRFWYPPNDENKPPMNEIRQRFKIRQEQFHGALGEEINEIVSKPIDIVSLRGYNFPICKSIFKHQKENIPHFNDTHPADLSYIDPNSHAKLYAGWQENAIKQMMKDKIHDTYRGSLIEVETMDHVDQIHSLDEGALLGIGQGITPGKYENKDLAFDAKMIQNAMKIRDDYMFCTLEPTGIILFYGITKEKVSVKFKSLDGEEVKVKQRAIVVGNKVYSGHNAWGKTLEKNLDVLEEFIL